LGSNAAGLSATTISRLKKDWIKEYDEWRRRDLSKRRIVYMWADGVYCNIRMDEAKLCLLVIIGADEMGRKHLLAVEEGYRESTQSWREVLLDLKRRGLAEAPKLAIGDGSLGFWNAVTKVYPATGHQRCWMHKTGNILNYLPKSSQAKAKKGIHEIWMAATRKEALKAFDSFVETYQAKYPKAVACLEKDREELLAFYDFPAEQWPHLRTTNPIESTFATVRLRTAKTRGCLSRETALTMVFKLTESAQQRWQRLRGFNLLADVVKGVRFINGEHPKTIAA
jgi:transposase-like protein